MKVSILSAAALLASGAVAAVAAGDVGNGVDARDVDKATIAWFVAPLCTATSEFADLLVAINGQCFNFGPFLPDSADISACGGETGCDCFLFEQGDCLGGAFEVVFSNGRTDGCTDLTQEFEFFSVQCFSTFEKE